MNELETEIQRLEKFVSQYAHGSADGNTLLEINKGLTTTLYYLEEERSKIHEQYQKEVDYLTQGSKETNRGLSVNRAQVSADIKYPNLYRLRRVMSAAYRISDQIRTHISYLKNEMNNA